MSAPLFALLLSGGSSRRMRTDKALLEYAGRPQLLRTWEMLQEVNVAKVVVSINPEQCEEAVRAGLPTLVDRIDSVGPVAGLLSAQMAEPDAAWMVVACDLPLLDVPTLETLISARAPHCDATAFDSRHDGLPEPLCAIWEPSSTTLLKQRYEARLYCPRSALQQLRTHRLPSPGRALDNVNTPEELDQARRQLEWN